MNKAHDRSGGLFRGLIALGVAAGVSAMAALVGAVAPIVAKSTGSGVYIWGLIAVSTLATLIIIFTGSRLFLRAKAMAGTSPTTRTGIEATDTDTTHDAGAPERHRSGFQLFGFLLIYLSIFDLGLEVIDRVGETLMGVLASDRPPITSMFAIGVTPIMLLLAVAERPAGARIKWRTIVFTVALWPAALLADTTAPYAADFEGPLRLLIGHSTIVVLVAWIGLGGALGTLDLMFALSNPREYEKKLQPLPLAEGWRFWHGAPLVLLLFSMRWQNGWEGIPEIAGDPVFFAGLLAAATVALCRPRDARGWAAACLAGVLIAALLLGGAVAAGRAVALAGIEGFATTVAVDLLLALPAIALAVVSVVRLGPPARKPGEDVSKS